MDKTTNKTKQRIKLAKRALVYWLAILTLAFLMTLVNGTIEKVTLTSVLRAVAFSFLAGPVVAIGLVLEKAIISSGK